MGYKRKRLLVVDDERDILEFLQILLEEEGYDVLMATKGEYLEQLQGSELPSLILLDVFLSGKDGREIVKMLKSRDETKHIPVIMISAHPSTEETARAAGADDFLSKPFPIDELLRRIERYL